GVWAQAMTVQVGGHLCLQPFGRAGGREAEIASDRGGTGDDVARSGSCVQIRDLEGGGREVFVAFVPADRGQFGQGRGEFVNRVAGQVRVGHVALDAVHRDPGRHRATAAVLDRVAQRLDRGRLADDAVVGPFAARFQHAADIDRAVGRRPFVVGGYLPGEGALLVGELRATLVGRST